jgi:hypothetical protein
MSYNIRQYIDIKNGHPYWLIAGLAAAASHPGPYLADFLAFNTGSVVSTEQAWKERRALTHVKLGTQGSRIGYSNE